jgi:hypothetical protein
MLIDYLKGLIIVRQMYYQNKNIFKPKKKYFNMIIF